MHFLFGDRLLRRFAGDLKRRGKLIPSKDIEPNPKVDAELPVRPDRNITQNDCEKELVDGKDMPIGEGPDKQNEIGLNNE
jgi:hypothetical protein